MEAQQAQQPKMVKVKILKFVGQHKPGDEIELPEDQAAQLCKGSEVGDGHGTVTHQKAMLLSDFEAMKVEEKDPSKMTMADMQVLGLKNIVETPGQQDNHRAAIAEDLNLKGVPVSASEPFTTTGGVTPPTTVNPALQKAAGRPHVSAESLFPKKGKEEAKKDGSPDSMESKKPEDKKQDDPKKK